MSKSLKKLDEIPDDDDLEWQLQSMVVSWRIEGFEVPDELIERVLHGELDPQDEIDRILARCKKTTHS